MIKIEKVEDKYNLKIMNYTIPGLSRFTLIQLRNLLNRTINEQ